MCLYTKEQKPTPDVRPSEPTYDFIIGGLHLADVPASELYLGSLAFVLVLI